MGVRESTQSFSWWCQAPYSVHQDTTSALKHSPAVLTVRSAEIVIIPPWKKPGAINKGVSPGDTFHGKGKYNLRIYFCWVRLCHNKGGGYSHLLLESNELICGMWMSPKAADEAIAALVFEHAEVWSGVIVEINCVWLDVLHQWNWKH